MAPLQNNTKQAQDSERITTMIEEGDKFDANAAIGCIIGIISFLFIFVSPIPANPIWRTVIAGIGMGIAGQFLAMREQAEEIASHLDDSESEVLDAVEAYRPNAKGAKVTNKFPLKNDVLIKIFRVGVSTTTFDRTTGERKKKVAIKPF